MQAASSRVPRPPACRPPPRPRLARKPAASATSAPRRRRGRWVPPRRAAGARQDRDRQRAQLLRACADYESLGPGPGWFGSCGSGDCVLVRRGAGLARRRMAAPLRACARRGAATRAALERVGSLQSWLRSASEYTYLQTVRRTCRSCGVRIAGTAPGERGRGRRCCRVGGKTRDSLKAPRPRFAGRPLASATRVSQLSQKQTANRKRARQRANTHSIGKPLEPRKYKE
jgi:hypothetical protein